MYESLPLDPDTGSKLDLDSGLIGLGPYTGPKKIESYRRTQAS
jgi:hypothetical protein